MALRSQYGRAARMALIPVSLAVAGAAFVHAASEAEMLSVGPGTSSRLGLDAHIAGVVADSQFQAEMARRQQRAQNQFSGLPEPLVALARDVYAADPLETSALRTIALSSVGQGGEQQARRIMRLAAQMSKRDSIVNLWLAQDYGRSGDLEAMVESFDHTLRTSERAREYAMKPVVDALASEDSYAPLGKLLSRRPEWENDFWRELASNPIGVANASRFLRASGIPIDRIPAQIREPLYANLKKARQYDTLFEFVALDPAAATSSDALAAGRFVTAEAGNPLGWALRSEGAFAARVREQTGELQIDARSGSFGIAADRIARGGGNYRLSVTMVEPVPENARIKLSARCADGAGRSLAIIGLAPGERGGEAPIASDGCEFVSLELGFEVEEGRRDALLRVGSIALRPA